MLLELCLNHRYMLNEFRTKQDMLDIFCNNTMYKGVVFIDHYVIWFVKLLY